MNPVEIRRLIIKSLFADDELLAQLVLKGGNALNLVHNIGNRSSLDIDCSMEGEFEDIDKAQQRIFGTLKKRFEVEGLSIFDTQFEEISGKTSAEGSNRWGGYNLKFKVIPQRRFDELKGDVRKAQIQALVTGPTQETNFRIQISKFEFCRPKREVEFEDYSIYVYTPAMIAIEKLRAICQQMPDYPLRQRPTARARDFYDIYMILLWRHIDLRDPETHGLARNIFEAKSVSLKLLSRIGEYREFHRQDWPQVQNAVILRLREFDFYFDSVLENVDFLKPLWEV